MIRPIHVFLSVVLIVSFFATGGGHALGQEQTESVEAEGIATILQGNTDIARDKAIVDAQRKAVEQAVGVLMSSESIVENYDLLSDRILTQSAGYIKSYQVLDEKKDGNEYRVRIQADIGLGDLKTDVEAIQHLIRQKGNPRMMFLIDETIEGLRIEILKSGFVNKKGLYVLSYQAPKLHYFNNDKEEFEKVVSSLRIN